MSSDSLREQRLKHVTGLATRIARNQINDAEKVFAPIAVGDKELDHVMWAAYIGHMAGRLAGVTGRVRALAIITEVLSHYENPHEH